MIFHPAGRRYLYWYSSFWKYLPADAAAFGQLFADYELLPPFRQLDRNSYADEAERNASELTLGRQKMPEWSGNGAGK